MGPRAKIACIDARPEDRDRLAARLESLYTRHRQGLRFGVSLEFYTSSREELFVCSAPNAFIIGSGLTAESSFALCRELRNSYPQVPILLFLAEDSYSLRLLRRFESVCDDVFSEDETELRIVHSILRHCRNHRLPQLGRIFNCIGAKGGVGTTTTALFIADVLVKRGSRVAVIDLSRTGVIPFYLSCPRWESRKLAVALQDDQPYSEELYEDCLVKAPNGISVLLPPSGGSEVRDIWLHDKNKLELSISLTTHLAEEFDYIIVDSAQAEGLLPFALACRAELNLLVSNNEAASVHLAGQMLSDVLAIPGEGACGIICNSSLKDGLSQNDMLEFLEKYSGYSDVAIVPPSTPYDTQARYWIGSGESFYSCATQRTKSQLESITGVLLGAEPERKQAGFFRRLLLRKEKARKKEQLYLTAPESPSDTLEKQSLYTPPTPVSLDKSESLRCGVWKQQ